MTVIPGSSSPASGTSSKPTCATRRSAPADPSAFLAPMVSRFWAVKIAVGAGAAASRSRVALLGRLLVVDVTADQPFIGFYASGLERCQVSAVAFGGRVDLPEVTEEPDPGVPGVNQVTDGQPGTAEVVADHRVRGNGRRGPVGEHHLGPRRSSGQQVAVIGAAGDDDQTVDPPGAEGLKQRSFPRGVAVGARAHDKAVLFAHHVLDRAQQLGRERVRDVLEQDPDDRRGLAGEPQVACRDVVPVVELLDGPPYPRRAFRANAIPAVDDAGDSHDADPRQRCHIAHGRVSTTPGDSAGGRNGIVPHAQISRSPVGAR